MNTFRTSTQALRQGALDTLPLVVSAIPFGIVYGALAHQAGLSDLAALLMSVIVFAGSSQFIAVSLIGASAAWPVILLAVFFVNLRHMLYSASLMPHVTRWPQWLRAPLAFWLTDETYAVLINRLTHHAGDPRFHYYYLGSALFMYSNWLLCSWLGLTLSAQVPQLTEWGLDIAMVVAFIGIVVPALKHRADWACAAVAGIGAVLTYDWPHQLGLLSSAMVAIAVGVRLESAVHKKGGDR